MVTNLANRGPFYWMYGATFGEIPDGLSNTFAMLEMLQSPTPAGTPPDRRGRPWNDDSGCYQINTDLSPNSRAPDRGICLDHPDLKLPCIRSGAIFQMTLASRSRHSGGVNILRCDASTQFMSENVNIVVYRAMSTKGGGEVAQLDN